MIKGTGIDIIDIKRIKKTIEEDTKFIEKIFTREEIEYCQAKHKKEIHYAARFASKEAFFKALGTGWRYGMKWQEISISNNLLGKPEISISGKVADFFKKQKLKTIHLSISHTHEQAIAQVIIE
jgi:holo-[acyl-carrier protein] synthase